MSDCTTNNLADDTLALNYGQFAWCRGCGTFVDTIDFHLTGPKPNGSQQRIRHFPDREDVIWTADNQTNSGQHVERRDTCVVLAYNYDIQSRQLSQIERDPADGTDIQVNWDLNEQLDAPSNVSPVVFSNSNQPPVCYRSNGSDVSGEGLFCVLVPLTNGWLLLQVRNVWNGELVNTGVIVNEDAEGIQFGSTWTASSATPMNEERVLFSKRVGGLGLSSNHVELQFKAGGLAANAGIGGFDAWIPKEPDGNPTPSVGLGGSGTFDDFAFNHAFLSGLWCCAAGSEGQLGGPDVTELSFSTTNNLEGLENIPFPYGERGDLVPVHHFTSIHCGKVYVARQSSPLSNTFFGDLAGLGAVNNFNGVIRYTPPEASDPNYPLGGEFQPLPVYVGPPLNTSQQGRHMYVVEDDWPGGDEDSPECASSCGESTVPSGPQCCIPDEPTDRYVDITADLAVATCGSHSCATETPAGATCLKATVTATLLAQAGLCPGDCVQSELDVAYIGPADGSENAICAIEDEGFPLCESRGWNIYWHYPTNPVPACWRAVFLARTTSGCAELLTINFGPGCDPPFEII